MRDDDDAVARAVCAVCPGFAPEGPVTRSAKTALLPGRVGGRAVLAKRRAGRDPLWAWTFAREVALYRAFADDPPPVRAPRLVAGDAATLVLERLAGAPLTPRRYGWAGLDAAAVAGAVAAFEALRAWPRGLALAPRDRPPAPVAAALRDRLMPDGASGAAWCVAGIARCAALGLVADADAALVAGALGRAPVVFAHGDALPRNVLADGGGVALVDWEFAGAHPQGWDLGLLWAALPDDGRALVARAVGAWSPEARAALWACAAFALARELKIQRISFKRGEGDPVAARLARDLAAALAALRAAP